jgi:hypothetical protein
MRGSKGSPETKCSEIIKPSLQMFSAASDLLTCAAGILSNEECR